MIGFPFKSACFERPFFKAVKHHLEVLLQFKYIAILFKLFSSTHLNNYIGMKTIKYNISQLRNSTRRKPLVGIFQSWLYHARNFLRCSWFYGQD